MIDRYPVNEVFHTFQGEAHFTGTPATFIRMQGCPVGCPWCDTKHTWPDPHHVAALPIKTFEMIEKTADEPTFAWVEAHHLADMVKRRHVVVTGGEPAMHDLRPLWDRLDVRATMQVETSGTFPLRVADAAWVTLSPKENMPGGLKVRDDVVERANEIKWPVGKWEDVLRLAGFLKLHPRHLPGREVWVQPLSTSKKATQHCIEAGERYGFKLSLQTHKFAGVR